MKLRLPGLMRSVCALGGLGLASLLIGSGWQFRDFTGTQRLGATQQEWQSIAACGP
jgi:hypothetical protein